MKATIALFAALFAVVAADPVADPLKINPAVWQGPLNPASDIPLDVQIQLLRNLSPWLNLGGPLPHWSQLRGPLPISPLAGNPWGWSPLINHHLSPLIGPGL